MQKITEKLPKVDYNVLHIRLGDEQLLGNPSSSKDEDYAILYDYLKAYFENNHLLLLSDSPSFREYAKKKNNFYILPIKPTHFGIETDTDSLFDIITEFFSMQKALIIYSYSVYNWDSGFAKAASLIFNVPMVRIPRIEAWK